MVPTELQKQADDGELTTTLDEDNKAAKECSKLCE